MRSLALALALLASSAGAQNALFNGTPDSRFRVLDLNAGGTFSIATSPDSAQTILFATGEQVSSVVISNPQAFQVSVAASGDSLSLRAMGPTSSAILSIRTTQRRYEFELVPANLDPRGVPLVISFNYGASASSTRGTPPPPPILSPQIVYRLAGSKALRPASIGDDGSKTYIVWRDDQPIPAVFALGPSGSEEMVNGYVRGGTFTIDRVYEELLFKIDAEVTRAYRENPKKADQHGR